MVRYGTIGSGWIVDAFIAGAQQGAPQLEHRAVYSRSRETGEAFARKHGVNLVFTDLEAMAASDQIDAVYIASPNAFHYSQAKLFLEHGKHVLCEKTCVVNSAQMKELCRLADQNGVVFMEAIKFMHLPERMILREALAFVGPVHLARFDFSRYSSKFPQYLAGQCPNIFNPKMAAGCLMDMGIYSVFPAVHLFGLPRRVSASAVMLRTGADGAGAAAASSSGSAAGPAKTSSISPPIATVSASGGAGISASSGPASPPAGASGAGDAAPASSGLSGPGSASCGSLSASVSASGASVSASGASAPAGGSSGSGAGVSETGSGPSSGSGCAGGAYSSGSGSAYSSGSAGAYSSGSGSAYS